MKSSYIERRKASNSGIKKYNDFENKILQLKSNFRKYDKVLVTSVVKA